MELQNMFKSIFGGKEREPPPTVRLALLNDHQDVFFSRQNYSNDILLKTCFATLAKHIAKLEPTITRTVAGRTTQDTDFDLLQRVLTLAPNPYMTSYDLYYRIAYHLIQNQNVYVKIHCDRFSRVSALWVLDYLCVEPRDWTGKSI